MFGPISTPQIAELHHQPVLLVTDAGIPVSMGRMVMTYDEGSSAVTRVELEFETQRLKCALRVSAEHWGVLLDNWDGETTRYVLPHGDGFWLDEHEADKARVLAEFLRYGYASGHKSPRLRRRRPPG
jgi:hypothetical protein